MFNPVIFYSTFLERKFVNISLTAMGFSMGVICPAPGIM
jgi:hypothetical protein